MGMVFIEGVSLHHSPTLAMFHLRDLGAHAPAYLEGRTDLVVARPRVEPAYCTGRPVSAGMLSAWCRPFFWPCSASLPKSSALGLFHQHEYLGLDAQLRILDRIAEAGSQGPPRLHLGA